MRRILHIGKFFPPFAGGIESFMADLMAAQQQQGEKVMALAHDHRWPEWRRLWLPVKPDKPDYPYLYRAPCFGRLLYAPLSPHFPFWLHHSIKQFRPQVLHLHLPNTSAFYALLSPAARRLPWVAHWHSDVVNSRWDKRLALAYQFYRPFEQRLLHKSRAIIATSPPYLDSSRPLSAWERKCHVIPLGVALQRLPMPGAESLAWADQVWRRRSGLRVLNVGRLTYYKGQTFLLAALSKLENVQALIVGEGELQEKLSRQIESAGLQNKVELLGFRRPDELAALFQTCDVFCLPSLERTEAFGVVLLEAMRYGKAVVAGGIPGSGVTWVVQHNHTGLLVPLADAGELARTLSRLAADADLVKEMGQAGFKRFHQTFQIGQVAEAVKKLYDTLVD